MFDVLIVILNLKHDRAGNRVKIKYHTDRGHFQAIIYNNENKILIIRLKTFLVLKNNGCTIHF